MPQPEPAPWPQPAPEQPGVGDDDRFARQFVPTGPLPTPEPVVDDGAISGPVLTQQPVVDDWWQPEPAAAQPAPAPHDVSSPTGATQLAFSDGQVMSVDEPLLVGRVPQAYPGEEARLVRVASPHHDISRTHVRIELYDGAVWATDRDSTNGTVVHNPGQEPITARPNQPVHVWVGGVIDIGDGMTIQVN